MLAYLSVAGRVKCRAALALRKAVQSLHQNKSALYGFYRRMQAKLLAPQAIAAAAQKPVWLVFHLIATRQECDSSKICCSPTPLPKAPKLFAKRNQRAKFLVLLAEPMIETVSIPERSIMRSPHALPSESGSIRDLGRGETRKATCWTPASVVNTFSQCLGAYTAGARMKHSNESRVLPSVHLFARGARI